MDDIIASTIVVSDEIKRELLKLNEFLNKGKPVKATVNRINKFIDKSVVLAGIPEKSPCNKGCHSAACCHYAVDVTKAEAVVIADEYNLEPSNLTEGFSVDTTGNPDKTACPFLHNNKCQIYKHRPIPCRIYHSLEPLASNCTLNSEGLMYNMNSSNVYQDLLNFLLMANPSIQGGGDIRHFFGTKTIRIKNG